MDASHWLYRCRTVIEASRVLPADATFCADSGPNFVYGSNTEISSGNVYGPNTVIRAKLWTFPGENRNLECS